MTTKVKFDRKAIVAALIERDGTKCMYPGCGRELDFNATGRREVTIDHIFPKSKARLAGWTEEEINDLSNLQLFEKICNAKKSDLEYNDDGTLPSKGPSRMQIRREKRAQRAARTEMCGTCFSGRILMIGEVCPDCGSGPQPSFPTAYQMRSDECPHEGPWSCYSCIVGITPRKPAYIDVFDIENAGIED